MALGRILIYVLMLTLGFAGQELNAQEITIGFDDLQPPDYGEVQIPQNYMGLQWVNFYALNSTQFGGTGYYTGMVSPNNVAFNGYGYEAIISSSSQFDLVSAYLTAAFEDGVLFEAQGYVGQNLVYDNFYSLNYRVPAFADFNYLGVTEVDFYSYGDYQANEFVMDNLTVNLTPEPRTGVLLGLGACLLVLIRKARKWN